MDVKLVGAAVQYHGKEFLQSLTEEQGETPSPNVVSYLQRWHPREPEIKSKQFQHDLYGFIARKSDLLFRPLTDEEKNNSKTEPFIDDSFAIMPPLETFMNVPSYHRREHFWKSLQVDDCVTGVVSSIVDHGLRLTLLCVDKGVCRSIDDLDIPAFCPVKELPRLYAKESALDAFQKRDIVRGIVLSVNEDTERIIMSLRAESVPDEKTYPRIGLITEDDFPVHYRRQSQIQDMSHAEMLQSILGFNNTGNVQALSSQLSIPSQASYFRFFSRLKIPEKEYAEGLKKWQSQKLAHGSVVQGVEMFKKGDYLEAMQHLNRALQIDAENVEALVARGALYANKENFPDAIKDFEEALKVNPKHNNARNYLLETLLTAGKMCEDRRELSQAEAHYSRALQIDQEHKEAEELLRACQKILAFQTEAESKTQESHKDTTSKKSSKFSESSEEDSPSHKVSTSSVLKTSTDKLKALIKEDKERKPRSSKKERRRRSRSSSSSRDGKKRKQKRRRKKKISRSSSSSSVSDSSSSRSRSRSSSAESSHKSRKKKMKDKKRRRSKRSRKDSATSKAERKRSPSLIVKEKRKKEDVPEDEQVQTVELKAKNGAPLPMSPQAPQPPPPPRSSAPRETEAAPPEPLRMEADASTHEAEADFFSKSAALSFMPVSSFDFFSKSTAIPGLSSPSPPHSSHQGFDRFLQQAAQKSPPKAERRSEPQQKEDESKSSFLRTWGQEFGLKEGLKSSPSGSAYHRDLGEQDVKKRYDEARLEGFKEGLRSSPGGSAYQRDPRGQDVKERFDEARLRALKLSPGTSAFQSDPRGQAVEERFDEARLQRLKEGLKSSSSSSAFQRDPRGQAVEKRYDEARLQAPWQVRERRSLSRGEHGERMIDREAAGERVQPVIGKDWALRDRSEDVNRELRNRDRVEEREADKDRFAGERREGDRADFLMAERKRFYEESRTEGMAVFGSRGDAAADLRPRKKTRSRSRSRSGSYRRRSRSNSWKRDQRSRSSTPRKGGGQARRFRSTSQSSRSFSRSRSRSRGSGGLSPRRSRSTSRSRGLYNTTTGLDTSLEQRSRSPVITGNKELDRYLGGAKHLLLPVLEAKGFASWGDFLARKTSAQKSVSRSPRRWSPRSPMSSNRSPVRGRRISQSPNLDRWTKLPSLRTPTPERHSRSRSPSPQRYNRSRSPSPRRLRSRSPQRYRSRSPSPRRYNRSWSPSSQGLKKWRSPARLPLEEERREAPRRERGQGRWDSRVKPELEMRREEQSPVRDAVGSFGKFGPTVKKEEEKTAPQKDSQTQPDQGHVEEKNNFPVRKESGSLKEGAERTGILADVDKSRKAASKSTVKGDGGVPFMPRILRKPRMDDPDVNKPLLSSNELEKMKKVEKKKKEEQEKKVRKMKPIQPPKQVDPSLEKQKEKVEKDSGKKEKSELKLKKEAREDKDKHKHYKKSKDHDAKLSKKESSSDVEQQATRRERRAAERTDGNSKGTDKLPETSANQSGAIETEEARLEMMKKKLEEEMEREIERRVRERLKEQERLSSSPSGKAHTAEDKELGDGGKTIADSKPHGQQKTSNPGANVGDGSTGDQKMVQGLQKVKAVAKREAAGKESGSIKAGQEQAKRRSGGDEEHKSARRGRDLDDRERGYGRHGHDHRLHPRDVSNPRLAHRSEGDRHRHGGQGSSGQTAYEEQAGWTKDSFGNKYFAVPGTRVYFGKNVDKYGNSYRLTWDDILSRPSREVSMLQRRWTSSRRGDRSRSNSRSSSPEKERETQQRGSAAKTGSSGTAERQETTARAAVSEGEKIDRRELGDAGRLRMGGEGLAKQVGVATAFVGAGSNGKDADSLLVSKWSLAGPSKWDEESSSKAGAGAGGSGSVPTQSKESLTDLEKFLVDLKQQKKKQWIAEGKLKEKE